MNSKTYQLYAIGNGIVDILVDISDREFSSLLLTKGSMNLVSDDIQNKILAKLNNHKSTLVSGGSVGNSVVAFQQLGGRSAFGCILGDDQYGRFYKEEFNSLGISLNTELVPGRDTGRSLVLITPDAERTMNTSLGIAAEFTPEHLCHESLSNSEWVFIEGYLLALPETGFRAALEAAKLAKRGGAKVALTFSDVFLINSFRESLDKIVDYSDLIFANHNEACAYTKVSDTEKAFSMLKDRVKNVVVTRSEKGALIHYDNKDFTCQAYPCRPVDMTGAGDMFAGSFMYGIINGHPVEECGRKACYLSMKVISQVGARLKGDLKSMWQEVPEV